MALHIHHHHLPLPGADEGSLQTQGKWLACLAIPCWLCFPSAPQGAISKSRPPPQAPKPPQSQCWALAHTVLGTVAGLGDSSLFSASLFKAQLSGVPVGLFPHAAAASVLQGSSAVASVIVVKMLALGASTVFLPGSGYFYMLSGPPAELAAPAPHSWLLPSQGPLQLWARWGPLVAKQGVLEH